MLVGGEVAAGVREFGQDDEIGAALCGVEDRSYGALPVGVRLAVEDGVLGAGHAHLRSSLAEVLHLALKELDYALRRLEQQGAFWGEIRSPTLQDLPEPLHSH